MSFQLTAILSMSVGIAAILGLILLQKKDQTFYPFIILLWLGFITEITSYFTIKQGYSNALIINTFILLESLLLLLQFYKWKFFDNKWFYIFLQFFFMASWLTETLYKSLASQYNSIFIITYSAFCAGMSIHMINKTMFRYITNIWQNPVFLICVGFLIYFSFAALIEVFWLYGLNKTNFFRAAIYDMHTIINLFTNLLFVFAILCIPKKLQFTTHLS